jgi:hypothetical protein
MTLFSKYRLAGGNAYRLADFTAEFSKNQQVGNHASKSVLRGAFMGVFQNPTCSIRQHFQRLASSASRYSAFLL